jgi:biotin carboxyl carrier protein
MGADQQSMKLHAAIADYQTEIQIREDGGRVFADLGGRAYELDAHESADGYLLTYNGQVFNCRVEGRPESGKAIEVIVGATPWVLTLTDPKRLRTAASASVHGDDAARIVAPMPGKVVRVMVEAGAKVAAGDGIIVVEAMKMQNEIKAPKAGTVIALNVQTGATVNGGDVLAIIE